MIGKKFVFTILTAQALCLKAYGASCPLPKISGFLENPKALMNAHPQKFDDNCAKSGFTLFDGEDIGSLSYIEKKDEARKSFCHTDAKTSRKVCLNSIRPGEDVLSGKGPIEGLDRAENLVPARALTNSLSAMEERGLMEGAVAVQPWSDWYWPIAVGQLSYRYNDPEMMVEMSKSGLDEKNMWTWVNKWHSINSMPVDQNRLSPAEKYDLLMGDANYTLTRKMLEAGNYYQKSFGRVEGWMGLCHGWAPASYMLPRPFKSLDMELSGGEKLTFLPSDLKALGTLLWSTGRQMNKFVGGRCNTKNPEKDPETGRVLDSRCFDTNPGSWHKTVVGQIGTLKKPFVMDATFDYEVWNHPVTSYSYTYFNPQSMTYQDELKSALVHLKDFKEDKFSAFRGPEAASVAGVVMEVTYLVETRPSTSATDALEKDAFQKVQYIYDLELDGKGNIVGGEWYTNKHPDFLWTPYSGSKAHSVVDDHIGIEELSLDMVSHPELKRMAPYASENGQPIGRVVEAMLREANK